MSHKTGKVEVVARLGSQIVFRYRRAPDPRNCGRVLIFDSNPAACWLDDYNAKVQGQPA